MKYTIDLDAPREQWDSLISAIESGTEVPVPVREPRARAGVEGEPAVDLFLMWVWGLDESAG